MIELESAVTPNPQTHSPVGKADSQRLFRQYRGGHLKWAGCGGQARGIFLDEGLPELNLGGIVELAGTVGSSRSTGGQEIVQRTKLPGSRPSAAGEEAVRDPGASPWRTLSAR